MASATESKSQRRLRLLAKETQETAGGRAATSANSGGSRFLTPTKSLGREGRTASSGRVRTSPVESRLKGTLGSVGNIGPIAGSSPSRARNSLSPRKISRKRLQDAPATSESNVEEKECPLSNPNFPPIAELDHKVGRCYCHLCNCGMHLCPLAFQKARLSQTLAESCYQSEYRRKEVPSAPKQFVLKPSYVPNSLPIDLLTTAQRDFQPFAITSPPRTKPSTAPSPLKFAFRSSYQAEFPNWGPNSVPEERRPQLPYRGGDVKMDMRTTYGKEFVARKVAEDAANRLGSTTGSTVFAYPQYSRAEFCAETTTGKEFGSPKSICKAKVVRRPIEQHALSESPRKIHFQSKYQRDFLGQQHAFRLPQRPNYLS